LPFQTLESSINYFRPRQDLPDRVRPSDSALDVMTDLSRVSTLMVSLTTPVNMALERMVKGGVRMLLVTEADGKVDGVITSRDIDSEKLQTILDKTGGTREDLVVGDIMTLKNKMQVLMMGDVLRAKVGDIVASLKEVDRQHTIVVDKDPYTGEMAVRGIFSLSSIAKQLGLKVEPSLAPIVFSDIEQAFDEL
jgi:CBS domain containing-hemolysin-like protein